MKIVNEEEKYKGSYYSFHVATLSNGKEDYSYEIIKNQMCPEGGVQIIPIIRNTTTN